MHHHHEARHSPYPAEALHGLVLDVLRYPEFLPWCKAARIIERHSDHFIAELVISFKGISESYVSKVAPKIDETGHHIDVSLVRGPFKHLLNRWHFSPAPDGGCIIDFTLDFALKYSWMDAILGTLFGKATEKMVGAFSTRADQLFAAPV